MSRCSDKVGALDTRVSRLRSERKDIEEIVGDTEDRAVGQVEFLLPCILSLTYAESGGLDSQVNGVLTSSQMILSLRPLIPSLVSIVSMTCFRACSTRAGQS
jgi:hypothetical protein